MTKEEFIKKHVDIPNHTSEYLIVRDEMLSDLEKVINESKLHQPTVISSVCENPHCHDGIVMFGENYRCGICEDKQTDL